MSHRAGHNISAGAVVWFDDWTRINPNNPSRNIQPHFVKFHVDGTTDSGTGRSQPGQRSQKGKVILHAILNHAQTNGPPCGRIDL
jgi:hypothetical protein